MTRLLLAGVALLSACMRPPVPLDGDFSATTVEDAQQASHVGERVRWGGTVVTTTPERERTCLEVVSAPLDVSARPLATDQTFGRFIACADGFYDPVVYAPNRSVTVVGTVEESSEGRVGKYDYVFPRVDADTVYLWPNEPTNYVRGAYWSPFWWDWSGSPAHASQ